MSFSLLISLWIREEDPKRKKDEGEPGKGTQQVIRAELHCAVFKALFVKVMS